nr:helicase-associated domain-containing protein [Gordonia araii]
MAHALAQRSDDELVELLRARPDLASPPPNGIGVLAQRAMSAGSMNVAGEELDLLHTAIIEALLHASTGEHGRRARRGVKDSAIRAALRDRAEPAEIDAHLQTLIDRAVVWREADGLHLAGHTPAALPWRAMHIVTDAGRRTPEQWRQALDAIDEGPRDVLTALATGPSVGVTRDAGPDADPARPVPILLANGLISHVEDQLVEIEPTVAQLIRGEPLLRVDDLRPPPLVDDAAGTPLPGGTKALSATAAGAAVELLRETGDVLASLGASPTPELSAGGIGIRELRRIAKETGLTPSRIGLIVELCARRHLIDVGQPDPEPPRYNGEPAWAPTLAADGWSHQSRARQWATLVTAWLALDRRTWLIGERDADGAVVGALVPGVPDQVARRERRMVLATLADAEPGTAPGVDALVSALLWRRPRMRRRLTRHAVSETLREATEVGLVAHGALTEIGRLVLDDPDDDELVAAMDAALPEPVDHFLAQADLTLMVPGPMTPELAAEVALVADLESAGAASVYRVTEDSVRRALDAGRTGAELNALFANHSSTPVPQSLTYLIDDVARRHGTLRVGVASSFVRCDDPATMAAVLRSKTADALALRPLAPTVLVSPAPVRDVLDALREAGFTPAAEDSSGALVDLRSAGSRVVTRHRQPAPRRPAASATQLASVVTRMRTADAAAGQASRRGETVRASGGGESVSALITLAMRTGRRLRVDYVDSHGKASRHVVKVQLLRAGRLIAAEVPSGDEVQLSMHRITTVELLD